MDTRRPGRRHAFGFTLVEVLIALALVGIVGGFAAVAFRAPASTVYANNVRSLLLQARFEAVRLNTPVVVGWNAATGRFEAELADVSGASWCTSFPSTPFSVADPAEVGRVEVDTDITAFVEDGEVVLGQLVWLPSGQARTCTNNLYGNTYALIRDQSRTARIDVSFGGRVDVR